jgi:GNAT superfamily N-acetyltransferase
MTPVSRRYRFEHAPVVQYREATEIDADPIALLHADSWRRHYRGAFLNAYLDGDIVPERRKEWTKRLAHPRSDQFTVCAEIDGAVIGFAHMIIGHDPRWGALLDNLHVRSDIKRTGVGTALLSKAAQALIRRRPSGMLYLWVLDQNVAAQTFYEARGGCRVETTLRGPFPGGGRALGHRYVWLEPRQLISSGPSSHDGPISISPAGLAREFDAKGNVEQR